MTTPTDAKIRAAVADLLGGEWHEWVDDDTDPWMDQPSGIYVEEAIDQTDDELGTRTRYYRDPFISVDTCIAAWRELLEEQRFDVLANWSGPPRTAPLWTEGQWFLPAELLSDPDAARVLVTEIAEEVK